MNYLQLIFELPALVSATVMIAYLLPVKFEPRFAPLLMFIVGLLVLNMPETIDMALCLALPAAWLQRLLGIDLHGHEPLNVGPAVEKARSAAVAARDRVRKPKPVELVEFATRAYPSPDAEAEPEAEDPEPPVQAGTVKSFVPPL